MQGIRIDNAVWVKTSTEESWSRIQRQHLQICFSGLRALIRAHTAGVLCVRSHDCPTEIRSAGPIIHLNKVRDVLRDVPASSVVDAAEDRLMELFCGTGIYTPSTAMEAAAWLLETSGWGRAARLKLSLPGGILAGAGACRCLHFQPSEVLMSGHSKWATIKHKKGALDAKRGKTFTRLIKEITVAAKQGGGDPDGNPRLRSAVLAAKAENMPGDNIKKAIQRGTGELEGVNYEEITFEGYGPGGVAIMVEVTTDNRNRTVSEIRHTFSKNGGNLGSSGSVMHLFSKKGVIAIDKAAASEEDLMNIVLEAGGEDLSDEGDTWEILTDPAGYEGVLNAVKAAKIPVENSEVTMIASTYTKLDDLQARQMMRLLEALEDFDDTQNVYSNFDMTAEQMEQVAG